VDSRAALHLARWGPRWPGAEPLLRQACRQLQLVRPGPGPGGQQLQASPLAGRPLAALAP
jgi:hypothetical protein